MYKRTGECNLCGECCGYPRKTDGAQNNAWPSDWPESIESWDEKSLKESQPIFNLVTKKSGSVNLNGENFSWTWIKGHGLAKNNSNLCCPFLSDRKEDGTVPCKLYKDKVHGKVWDNICRLVPPEFFVTKEQLDNWNRNCPSCSYVYEEVK